MTGMLNILKEKVSLVLATKAVHPRATETEKILELANRLGVRAETATPVEAALNRALQLAVGGNNAIVSAGSMFVTAEVKTAWQKLNNRS